MLNFLVQDLLSGIMFCAKMQLIKFFRILSENVGLSDSSRRQRYLITGELFHYCIS